MTTRRRALRYILALRSSFRVGKLKSRKDIRRKARKLYGR